MKKLFVVLFLLAASSARAQGTLIDLQPSDPFTCDGTVEGSTYGNTTTHLAYYCTGSAWLAYGLIGGGASMSFPLLAPDGSAAAPSYSFTNSTTSGMWLDSAGNDILSVTSTDPVGANQTGGAIDLTAGRGTGTGAGGALTLRVSPPDTVGGSTPNTLQTIASFSGADGTIALGGVNFKGTPATSVWSAAHRTTGVTDSAGGALTIRTGTGTGTGAGGALSIQVPQPGLASGSAQNTFQQFLNVNGTSGVFTMGGLQTPNFAATSTIAGADRLAGVANGAANGLLIRGGIGTGTGIGGPITFQVAPASLTPGSTQNNLQTIFFATGNGTYILGGATDFNAIATGGTVLGNESSTTLTDAVGGQMTIRGGRGTGTGGSGGVQMQVCPPNQTTGTTLNTCQDFLNVNRLGTSVFGGLDTFGAPGASTWSGTDRTAGVTDGAGGQLTIRAGQGTGTASGGFLSLQSNVPGVSSGTAQNASQHFILLNNAGGGGIVLGPVTINATNGGDIGISAGNRAAGVTDGLMNNNLSLEGGRGTGTGTGGAVRMRVAPISATGSALNTLQNALLITGQGVTTIGGVDVLASAGTNTYGGNDIATGVTDGAGGQTVVRSGQGTGTGIGGTLSLQVAPAATGTGTAQNGLITAASFSGAAGLGYVIGDYSVSANPVQSVVGSTNRSAGVTDGTGGDFLIRAGAGTGAGVGGSITLSVAPRGVAGTTVNPKLSAFTITGEGLVTLGGVDVRTSPGTSIIGGLDIASGITDTAGGALLLRGGQGTGTGLGGAFQVQVAPRSPTGSAQNALQTALTIDGEGGTTIGGVERRATGGANTFAGQDTTAGVADMAAGEVHISGGQGTGTGQDGNVVIRLAPPANATATTQNPLVDVERWDATDSTPGIIRTITLSGNNGATWVRGISSELLTLATGATTTNTTANLLPAGAIIEAVVTRVTTAITTATTFSVGDATTAARFSASAGGLTAASTRVGLQHQQGSVTTDAAGPVQTAAAAVRITTDVTPGAGVIRITVFYRQFVAPTS